MHFTFVVYLSFLLRDVKFMAASELTRAEPLNDFSE